MWEAGLRACRQPSDVIAAVYDGRIPRTFRLGKVRTLRDVLVNVDDVRSVLSVQQDDELISAEDCARTLRVNILAMRKIMQAGILKSVSGVNPVNQRRQMAARHTDLLGFDSRFVSLSAIRQHWRTTAPGMVTALLQVGVRPAFALDQSQVSIYRRADVAEAKGKLEAVMGARHAKYAGASRRRH